MSDRLEGYRLERLEVLNWGTFHKAVWAFDPGCRDALLTGDIGSGKSTLVDAVCTLLLPPQKVAFNKAAGADKRERDLRSYVLGHHRSATDEITGNSRAVSLRGPGSYSVILGVFANPALDSTVSLAKVFWYSTEPAGQPERFHVVADLRLSIAEHFHGFGSDIADLRKRLRRIDGCDVLGGEYTHFGTKLRRKLGIASEQALDLFHQTVSMKSVGSLDQFVREHMLEPFDSAKTVKDIVAHFDDLDQAHKSVVRAEEQIERLRPCWTSATATTATPRPSRAPPPSATRCGPTWPRSASTCSSGSEPMRGNASAKPKRSCERLPNAARPSKTSAVTRSASATMPAAKNSAASNPGSRICNRPRPSARPGSRSSPLAWSPPGSNPSPTATSSPTASVKSTAPLAPPAKRWPTSTTNSSRRTPSSADSKSVPRRTASRAEAWRTAGPTSPPNC
ncbi:hypothetical protein GCM10029992_07350 [Glycomyces albus]